MQPHLVEVNHQQLHLDPLAACLGCRRAIRHQELLAVEFELVNPNARQISHFGFSTFWLFTDFLNRIFNRQLQRFVGFLTKRLNGDL